MIRCSEFITVLSFDEVFLCTTQTVILHNTLAVPDRDRQRYERSLSLQYMIVLVPVVGNLGYGTSLVWWIWKVPERARLNSASTGITDP